MGSQASSQGRGGGIGDDKMVPLKFAKEQIKYVEMDMKKMHDKHSKLLKDMEENYKMIEEECSHYYLEFLDRWRAFTKEKILLYKKGLE